MECLSIIKCDAHFFSIKFQMPFFLIVDLPSQQWKMQLQVGIFLLTTQFGISDIQFELSEFFVIYLLFSHGMIKNDIISWGCMYHRWYGDSTWRLVTMDITSNSFVNQWSRHLPIVLHIYPHPFTSIRSTEK